MSDTSSPPPAMYDQIDLTWWITIVARRMRLVLAIAAAAVAAGLALSLMVFSPTLQSSAVVQLPSPSGAVNVDMSIPEYEQIATSDEVMQEASRLAGYQSDLQTLRRSFEFTTERESRSLSATVSSEDAEFISRLANQWVNAYGQRVEAKIEGRFSELMSQRKATVDMISSQQVESLDALAQLERENLIPVMQSEIDNIISRLDVSWYQRQLLTQPFISSNRTRLVALRRDLESKLAAAALDTSGISLSDASAMTEAISVAGRTSFLQNRVTQAEIDALTADLLDSEERRRTLSEAVRSNQARLDWLEARLPELPATIERPDPSSTSGQKDGSATADINPIYYHVSQQIEDTRSLLAADRIALETVTARIEADRASLEGLKGDLIAGQIRSNSLYDLLTLAHEIEATEVDLLVLENTARDLDANIYGLENELRELQGRYADVMSLRRQLEHSIQLIEDRLDMAEKDLYSLIRLSSDIQAFATVTVSVRPGVPTSPGPQSMVGNLLLSGVAGLMLGVIVAIVLELYPRRSPVPSNPPE